MCLGEDDDDKQNDDNSIQSEEDEPAGPDSGVGQEQDDVYIERMDRVQEIIDENKMMFKARKDKANGKHTGEGREHDDGQIDVAR